MADYSQIISGIHGGNVSGNVTDTDEYITINPETRQFEMPANFNTTIAFVGDVNSQVVRFLCPKEYDGHSLEDCSNHEIRWYNTSSGFGDKSPLEISDDIGENFILSWVVPPEATTKAGNVQCVISIYDKADYNIIKDSFVAVNDSVYYDNKTGYITCRENLEEDYGILELYVEEYDYDVMVEDIIPEDAWVQYESLYDGDEPEIIESRQLKKGDIIHVIGMGPNQRISEILPERPEYQQKQTYIKLYRQGEVGKYPQGSIAYQWNTAIFSGFNVGATLENVETSAPVRSKILTLNIDTKNIILPAGYNTTIASQYDIGVAHVYIQAPRYIHNMDLLDSSVGVYCGWHLPESGGIDRCQVNKQYSLIETDDLVLITWNVDQDLITNCNGNFSFELSVKQFNKPVGDEDKKLMKQWYSNINTALSIKPTLNIPQDIVPGTGLAEGVLVEAAVDLRDIEQLINDELYTGGTII